MRALVVVESVFGNTREIADAVADGLSTCAQVDLVDVGDAPEAVRSDVDLVVVGGPTHAFGMSRPSTRDDARSRAGRGQPSRGIGIREWIARLEPVPPGLLTATFDTRIASPRLPGSAAHAAHQRLRRLGCKMLAPSQSFWVDGTTGPLVADEPERARAWGWELARIAAIAVSAAGQS